MRFIKTFEHFMELYSRITQLNSDFVGDLTPFTWSLKSFYIFDDRMVD